MTVTRPQLVALDVDGTIVDYDNRMSEVVRTTLEAVVEAGHHVVVSTGRSVGGALETANRLGLTEGYVVASNGAVVVRLAPESETGWVVQHVETFDPGPALERMVEVMPTALYMVEDESLVRYASAEFPSGELADMEDFTIVSFDELKERRATRIVMRDPNGTSDDFRQAVERVGLHGVTYSVGWSNWLDIAPDGVSKAHGLEIVSELLDVAREDTIGAGDGSNDIEMIEWVDYGIVMGQAGDELKSFASVVTAPVGEDGLATALIERLGLGAVATA
ncbi:HAD family hydrolase [Brevibacterium jeotgali]|nr:HAD family hydrolase [Brevibacterium jeotgali]